MNNNKAKIFMIFGVLTLLIVVIASSSYAWYVWTTDDDDFIKIVTGVGSAEVTFDGDKC